MNKKLCSAVLGVSVFCLIGVPMVRADWWTIPTITIPALPTATPTPTTMKLFIPGKVVFPITTSTPTSTATPTVTQTITPSLTPSPTGAAATITEAPATGSSEANLSGQPEATSSQPVKTRVAGFTTNEIVFGGIIAVLLLSLIIQGNWANIKKWLHDKTS